MSPLCVPRVIQLAPALGDEFEDIAYLIDPLDGLDLSPVFDLMRDESDVSVMAYLGQFLLGVAKSADDTRLMDAARALSDALLAASDVGPALARLRSLVDDRLSRERSV